MPLISRDKIIVNSANTAVLVQCDTSLVDLESTLFPDCIAVAGNAADTAAELLLEQERSIKRRYFAKVLIFLGLCLTTLLLFMAQNQDFNLGHYTYPWLCFIPIIVFGLPLMLTSGNVTPDGIAIEYTVFEHLTTEERDGLFSASAEGPAVKEAALDILTKRHSCATKLRNEAHRAANNKLASDALQRANIHLDNKR